MCNPGGTTEEATEKFKGEPERKIKKPYAHLCEECIHEEVQ
jgi:hypothetical protein